jgi:DivIVA domain-containing protein
MGQLLILLAVALVAAALAWGVAVLLMGRDQGLEPAEPDGRAIPLPTARPLTESDIGGARFDTAARGYRMDQVDQALRRVAYDIGYKEELIGVLEAEVAALRAGRLDEADALRQAREAARRPRGAAAPQPDDAVSQPEGPAPAEPDDTVDDDAVPDEDSAAADDTPDWVAAGSGTAAAPPADAEK